MRLLQNGLLGLAAISAAMIFAALAAAEAAEADLIVAQIDYANAAVLVEVNGVPAFLAGEPTDAHQSNGDSRGLLSTWMIAGANAVTARAEKRGQGELKVTVTIMSRGAAEPLAKAEFTAPGAKTLTVNAQNLPRWSWQDAAPWNGKDEEVIASVNKFYQAVLTKDDAAVAKMTASFWADMRALFGPSMDEAHRVFNEELAKSAVRPLPPLRVTRYQNGRIIHVGPSDGTTDAPVAADLGNGDRLETGEWWALIGGNWQVIH